MLWYDRYRWLFFGAAAATAIAGILHIILVPISLNFNPMVGIFFLISGIVQLFWAYPTVRRWGIIWYYVGIGGTILLIILWAIARLPSIISEAVSLDVWDVSIVFFQIIYVGTATIIVSKRGGSQYDASQANRYMPIGGGEEL